MSGSRLLPGVFGICLAILALSGLVFAQAGKSKPAAEEIPAPSFEVPIHDGIPLDSNLSHQAFKGSKLRPPRVLHSTVPTYPEKLKMAGVEGRVTLRVLVHEDGRVDADRNQILVRYATLQEFVEPAKAAVIKTDFEPATNAGKLVKCYAFVTFRFELPVEAKR